MMITQALHTMYLHTSFMIYNVVMLWVVFYCFTKLNIKLVSEWSSIVTYCALMQVIKIHTHVNMYTHMHISQKWPQKGAKSKCLRCLFTPLQERFEVCSLST